MASGVPRAVVLLFALGLAVAARAAPLVARGESIHSAAAVDAAYRDAGARLLWSDPLRRTALLAAVRAAPADGLRGSDYHLAALEALPAAGPLDEDDDRLASDAFVTLLAHLALGKVDPVHLEPTWRLPRSEARQRALGEAIRAALASGRILEAAEAARPHHYLYEQGRAALARYQAIAAAGGWPRVGPGAKLAPGAHDARIPRLRQHLAIEDGLPVAAGDEHYDPTLVEAVRAFQGRHGLPRDGVLGDATIRELDVPVESRLDSLRLNLERGRWVLDDIGEGDLVVVDIAGFGVRYVRDRRVIWRGRAIVGRRYRQTPVFRAQISRVVLNPTWTVPPSILAKDVLPALARGEDALAHKHLDVYDRAGHPVDPTGIDWSGASAAHFPYVLRQAAGEANALGRVKIDFDNPYAVYLHDTPSRELFSRDERAFSSGCIRIDRPVEFAALVLGEPSRWSTSSLQAIIDAGTTRTIRLAREVPILVMYWTAEAGADGLVTFRRDLYGRDARLLRELDPASASRDQGRGKRPPPA